ncbi:hypothetical protein ACIBKY_23915 [Nonomuraea sp. NPDC050394]|uniref:hypothetical protein n=1 Tax=Nonomuraea sp. NPDC050394 TaxID=3364363 RepID=UPI0037B028DF
MKMFVAALAGGALLLSGTPALASGPTLGPYGAGKVKLGMSAKRAKATGKIVLKRSGEHGGCSGWDLKAYPTGKNSVGLYISRKRGVAVIFAGKGMRTPEGIGIGSTMRQVRRAYPKVRTSHGLNPYVTVPGNPKAYYTFFADKGKLEQLSIAVARQDCVS